MVAAPSLRTAGQLLTNSPSEVEEEVRSTHALPVRRSYASSRQPEGKVARLHSEKTSAHHRARLNRLVMNCFSGHRLLNGLCAPLLV